MIIKQYLLTTKALTTQDVLGGVSGRAGRAAWAQDGVSYTHSPTAVCLVFFFIFFIFTYLFGCAGSQLQHTGSLVRHVGSSSLTRD